MFYVTLVLNSANMVDSGLKTIFYANYIANILISIKKIPIFVPKTHVRGQWLPVDNYIFLVLLTLLSWEMNKGIPNILGYRRLTSAVFANFGHF